MSRGELSSKSSGVRSNGVPSTASSGQRIRRVTTLGGVLVASALVVACGGKERPPSIHALNRGKPIPEERLPATGDRFFETACEETLEDYATQCGFVLVDEGGDADRSLGIAVLRVFSNAKNARKDPIVYLEGGPGASPIIATEYLVEAFEPLLATRDLVFVDQRGTGESLPRLECDEDESFDGCYRALGRETDLSSFTTRNNASDVDRVRRELGYDKWNLYGISYGTRLGLTILRDYPGGVRTAVLDSVVPLEVDLLADLGQNGQTSFERVFAACAESVFCSEKYSDLMPKLREVVEAMNAAPVELEGGALDGDTFVAILFQLLYSPVAIEFLPFIIDEASRGRFGTFEEFAGAFGDGGGDGGGFSFAMHLSVQCADEFPFSSRDAIEGADLAVHPELRAGLSGREYVEYCASWPVAASSPIENEPVVSDVPSLVFSGYFDPITPPRYAAQVAASLSRAQYFEVGDQSHGASVSTCGFSLMNAFFDDPAEPLRGDCLGESRDLVFESLRTGVTASPADFAFRTRRPTPEEVARVRDDLRLRRHGHAPHPWRPSLAK